ncbi:hypothetical protein [Bradyrhizobium sp. SZCCHNS2005]|uniref:hypothetical protein n=1 Tax=Bradyrhizobium sp. SZCCHNS2005 TaxID=3057303 RepID=UPI0028E91420|nr:hypothetical protein [Bradyrhizobium sp. SZCCHNS2005]
MEATADMPETRLRQRANFTCHSKAIAHFKMPGQNKQLPKISKSVVCFARSGPDEGRTRRHDTLDRQCDGRSQGQARFKMQTTGNAADGEIAWSWPPGAEAKLHGTRSAHLVK